MIWRIFKLVWKSSSLGQKAWFFISFMKYFWNLSSSVMSTLSIDFMMMELITLNFNCKEGIWKWNKQGLKKVELLTALLGPWEHFYEALKSDISHKFDTYKTVCIWFKPKIKKAFSCNNQMITTWYLCNSILSFCLFQKMIKWLKFL